jgi:uncharacterized phage protein (TIGR02218 family)
MRFISAGLTSTTEGADFALATCIKITQRDGVERFFTDWDQNLTIGGDVYRADAGVQFYSFDYNAGFDTGTFAVEGLILSAAYSAKEIQAQLGFLSNAIVDVFQVNPEDLSQGVFPLKYGRVSRVLPKDLFWSLECETLDAKLSRSQIVKTYTRDCRWTFGDANCTVTPTSFAGEIAAIADDFVFTLDGGFGGPATAGFFSYGRIVFDDLPTFPNKVKSYDAGTKQVTLMLPAPYVSGEIAAGGTVTMFQGCKRTYLACRDTHSNVENFGGFPFIPGPKKKPLGIVGFTA